MTRARFVTVINCMDGRTQLVVNEWMRRRYEADHVDTITEPGPDGILATGVDSVATDSIRRRVAVSVEEHGSRVVGIVGHHDCAGNPVDKVTHLRQLEAAAAAIRAWGFFTDVVCLWVNENWQVEPLV
uniref:Carbonic anhydrase n=1 Tax=candidate division WOR-3 bacterium TaxID=2052148 RepID=A0A7C4GI44_UNCW3